MDDTNPFFESLNNFNLKVKAQEKKTLALIHNSFPKISIEIDSTEVS